MAEPKANPRQVVYLLGAGATQGCISHLGSGRNLLMGGLFEPLAERMQACFYERYRHDAGIERIVNDVVTPDRYVDIEQLMSFLEESTSAVYRDFASDLKNIFSSLLRQDLDRVERELGPSHPFLYAALVDMHSVPDSGEELRGILTLNYDVFLERAIVEMLGRGVDYGVDVIHMNAPSDDAVRVLKMHGSFGWSHEWPVSVQLANQDEFWIPPGIRKPKNEYPFNLIWGQARELLNCDVVRVIGCNLGPNDWDLVSLLFATRHTRGSAPPYDVEVIDLPSTIERVRSNFPYLEAKSLLDLDEIGHQIVGELLGIAPTTFDELTPERRREVERAAGETISNPFEYWLTQRGELLATELESISTDLGVFERFVDGVAA